MKILSFVVALWFVAFSAQAQYSLTPAFSNLTAFAAPLEMQSAGDGTDRLFVVEQSGRIYMFHNSATVSTRKVFLDLSGVVSQGGGEVGLLGLAFHPNFKSNGFIYVNYTASPGGQLTSFISRFRVNPSTADTVVLSTEQILLTVVQPFSNHNGGCLRFGNDGFLYAAFGDGGAGGDPLHNGQNKSVLLGKILRLDVDHQAPGLQYAIPPTNPFAGNTQGFKEEIYCYGMRNTWRFSFDRTTGRLWASDVGQDHYEEVDTLMNGGNYGWGNMEGFHCYPSGNFNCDSTGMTPPLWEYPHANGNVSVTGGFVYRGTTMPTLVGKYVYGDYGTGRIWTLDASTSPVKDTLIIDKASSAVNISSFAEDANKELYVIGYNTGKIYRVIQNQSAQDQTPPTFSTHNAGDNDTLFVSDSKAADLGIKNITWRFAPTTDSSNFTVAMTPALAPCSNKATVYQVMLHQSNIDIAGSVYLTFTDCADNRSYDTVRFLKHTFTITPDTINFGFVNLGGMSTKTVTLICSPNDGASYTVDSVVLLPPSGRSTFAATPKSPVPIIVGATTVDVMYMPTTPTSDTCLVRFYLNAPVKTFYDLHLKGLSRFLGTVSIDNSDEFKLSIASNPIHSKSRVRYVVSEFGATRLALYDAIGREVRVLVNESKDAGKYDLDFDASTLPSGSYILRYESGADQISKLVIKE
ncbi:MAG: PQQ-dependent sugar dehydrogenase [bacterium]